MAFVVRDDWQRKGIGTYLLKRLVRIGKENAIRNFTGYILPENSGMLRTVHHSGFTTETTTEDGVVRVTVTVGD